jgi:hypothetical protein
MELATIVLIVFVVAAGVMGPIARAWSLHLRQVDFERRLSLLESHKMSDENRDKAKTRWAKKDLTEMLPALKVPAAPPPDAQWWAQR